MNKCLNCGAEFVNDNFCPYCGTRLNNDSVGQVLDNQSNDDQVIKPNKTWDVFANLGLILGIVGIIANFLAIIIAANPDLLDIAVSFLSIGEMAIPGLVFSILGKKSLLKSGKAKVGIALNIIGIILSVIAVIVYVVVLITVLGEITFGPSGGIYTTFIR